MRPVITVIITLILLSVSSSISAQYSSVKIEQKVDSVLALMTLDEKIGQLNLPAAGDISTGLAQSTGIIAKIKEGKVGGLFNIRGVERIREVQKVAVEESRLGIPLLFAMDVIHGYKTVFPIPLGLSCSWDIEAVERSARIAAQEASADGIAWTFSPMVDLSRDPRWGRIAESGGEDPYLNSEIAKAMVNGYQGDDLSKENTLMACVKHFALYGASEAGRDYNTVDMSRLTMYNVYFPPYKAAIDAGVGTVMASFNEVDGIPATGNKWLMTEVLRNQWGFDGFVLSDYTGINEMIDHGVGDLEAVSALALKAGVDMDMVGEGFLLTLKKSLEEGKITEEDINKACWRILEAKFKLGLFDDPYRYAQPDRARREVYTDSNRNAARKIAAESMVLLKNEGDILPLKKEGTIAIIGPMGNNRENMQGTWSVAGDHQKSITLLEGVKEVAGENVNVLYAKGANFVSDPELEARFSIFGKNTYRDNRPEEEILAEALEIAEKADVIIAAVGEASEMSGESSSRTNIEMPDTQRRLLKALLDTGKPVAMVLFTGRPLALTWEAEYVPSILNAWFAGSEAGYAIADVLFGDVNPSGKLTATFPQNVGQIPIYYAHKNTGRPLEGEWFQKFRTNYLDVSNEPLFPFGYGLSYSEFKYGEMTLNKTSLKGEESLSVTINITNESETDGKEVVQLYIRDVVGTITRPVKELKDFQKVFIPAGTTKTVSFSITTDDLKFYNYDYENMAQSMKYDWEPGEFIIMVGRNSDEVQSQSVIWEK
ncbi:MAG: beta-glucosidase BglX [Balneolaceae bacterium]|nr:beta-glucosidase BglX [Balneolaceae bacterium]MBO6546895.1 beta-glucosidase BglX [Balneolaceae bacterium]MBO6649255.1 beta-glucosidase BglX [Balneolaceae bacterium]